MKICLIPLKIEIRNPSVNLLHLQTRLAEMSLYQPDLICLPECAFTGYLYKTQDFERFAEPVPGKTTAMVSRIAQEYKCYICFGLLEKGQAGVYSSAVLLAPSGQVVHVHRKIIERPPFAVGDQVRTVDTEFGKISVLLCGDLFHDEVKAKISKEIAFFILPLSRSFDGKSPDIDRWQREERQAYLDEIRKIGKTSLVVNSLEDANQPEASFGGAMVVSSDGVVLAEAEHGTDQILLYELESNHSKSR